jgi:hypothetical protein
MPKEPFAKRVDECYAQQAAANREKAQRQLSLAEEQAQPAVQDAEQAFTSAVRIVHIVERRDGAAARQGANLYLDDLFIAEALWQSR